MQFVRLWQFVLKSESGLWSVSDNSLFFVLIKLMIYDVLEENMLQLMYFLHLDVKQSCALAQDCYLNTILIFQCNEKS